MSAPKDFAYVADDWPRVAGELSERLSLVRECEDRRRLTYLDTFDWRVHRAGFVLARTDEVFEVSDRATGALVMRVPVAGHANGSNGNGDGGLPPRLRDFMSGVVGVRALLGVAALTSHSVVLAARNDDAKTVARLVLSDSRLDRNGPDTVLRRRLTVVPLRGYDKFAARLSDRLADLPGIEPVAESLLEEALGILGRRPGDYSGRLVLELHRESSTFDAARMIYRTLLEAMLVNEDGVVQDVDTECLHDFRVAVRRTRSALKAFAGALPVEVETHVREQFRWLGQMTTPTRDLDVHLLDFPSFHRLVGDVGDDLEPLRDLIRADRRHAHRRLCATLRSAQYRRLVMEWGHTIDAEDPSATQGPAGSTPIGELADSSLRRAARQVLRDGSVIDDDSAPEALHDLRKRCKELRYLLEFFSSLYNPKLHRSLVEELKALQLNLGEFQDTEIQRHALEAFAGRLLESGAASATGLLAIGRMVAVLEDRQRRARAGFAARFTEFAGASNRRRVAVLTGGSL
jgi:CHAD domain-containing protein